MALARVVNARRTALLGRTLNAVVELCRPLRPARRRRVSHADEFLVLGAAISIPFRRKLVRLEIGIGRHAIGL